MQQKTQTTVKAVEAIHQVFPTDYSGLITYTALPSKNIPMESLEPFLFLNHHGWQTFGPNNQGLPFGPHPHKGFETVTFILEGDLIHKDSTGYESNIKEGGIQWMTAGSGIIHSEQSSDEFKERGGPVEILQLWVNLPARLKLTAPNYIGLQKDQVPSISLDGGNVTLHLASGEWSGVKAPIQSLSAVNHATASFQPGGHVALSITATHAVLFYVIKGTVTVNGEEAEAHNLVVFGEGDLLDIKASTNAVVVIGHAAPNGEPIVAHGPFVMNTRAEINQAFVEYQQGKLGVWKG